MATQAVPGGVVSMNTLDDSTIYVFVRGDLPEEQQLVQTVHAVLNMARGLGRNMPTEGEPRIIALDGGQSEKAFQKTYRKLCAGMLPPKLFAEYKDPDKLELGVTAISTLPLTKEQALPLANYRLRRYSPPAEASAAVALDGQRGASLNASVAQTVNTEHSATNREVTGAIPAGSSTS